MNIINSIVNSVAMTVLPGNDYPTIAVFTDGGISVIDGPAGKGTVVDVSTGVIVSGTLHEDLWSIKDTSEVQVWDTLPDSDGVLSGHTYTNNTHPAMIGNVVVMV